MKRFGGEAVLCRSGHAFIKQRMREVDAVYGGEMSAHHYFRDFAYCDSGMIPWLLVLAVMCETGKSLRRAGRRAQAAVSGQRRDQSRNRPMPKAVAARVQSHYAKPRRNPLITPMGLSMEFDQWRFNLRGSNTEPLVRLNVESRGNEALMHDKTAEVLGLMENCMSAARALC